MTRARASSAPAGADEAPARAPRRAVPLRASQMRQRRAPASGPRDCCARLAQAGVRNPCDQTPPFWAQAAAGRSAKVHPIAASAAGFKRQRARPSAARRRRPAIASLSGTIRSGEEHSGRACLRKSAILHAALPAPVSATCEPLVAADHHCPLHAIPTARSAVRATAAFGRRHKPPEFAGSSASSKRRRRSAYARSRNHASGVAGPRLSLPLETRRLADATLSTAGCRPSGTRPGPRSTAGFAAEQ